MKKVLVTGGAGYIGSHTVKYLASRDFEITVLDNLVYGHEDAIVNKNVTLVKGDIGDKALLDNLFSKGGYQGVVHFAAYAYVGESVQNPGKYYRNNVVAPMQLLDSMLEHGIKKLIFSSTCATYGNPVYLPLNEQHPQAPINPYGKSKLMLEEIIRDYHAAYGLQYVILRYFNACGASADGQIGEDHNPETHLIPLILDAAAGDRDAITVFGTDYDTPDGTCIRDYVHVEDLASAHHLAFDYLLENKPSIACNLGTGFGFSVKEVIKAAEEVTGKSIPVKYGERRAGDPSRLYAEVSLAAGVLGWKARYTDIKTIIQTAWNWKTGPNKGKYKR